MARILLNFVLRDVDGDPYPASRLYGRPTVLVLLRHLGCLFCQQHLSELRPHVAEIENAGGRIAVISFAPPQHLAGFAAALGHPYLWLSDPERASYQAMAVGHGGLLNPFSPADIWRSLTGLLRGKPWIPQQADVWQLGADFVFDSQGRLTMAHRCRSSHDRPPVAEVMKAFRAAVPVAASLP